MAWNLVSTYPLRRLILMENACVNRGLSGFFDKAEEMLALELPSDEAMIATPNKTRQTRLVRRAYGSHGSTTLTGTRAGLSIRHRISRRILERLPSSTQRRSERPQDGRMTLAQVERMLSTKDSPALHRLVSNLTYAQLEDGYPSFEMNDERIRQAAKYWDWGFGYYLGYELFADYLQSIPPAPKEPGPDAHFYGRVLVDHRASMHVWSSIFLPRHVYVEADFEPTAHRRHLKSQQGTVYWIEYQASTTLRPHASIKDAGNAFRVNEVGLNHVELLAVRQLGKIRAVSAGSWHGAWQIGGPSSDIIGAGSCWTRPNEDDRSRDLWLRADSEDLLLAREYDGWHEGVILASRRIDLVPSIPEKKTKSVWQRARELVTAAVA